MSIEHQIMPNKSFIIACKHHCRTVHTILLEGVRRPVVIVYIPQAFRRYSQSLPLILSKHNLNAQLKPRNFHFLIMRPLTCLYSCTNGSGNLFRQIRTFGWVVGNLRKLLAEYVLDDLLSLRREEPLLYAVYLSSSFGSKW